MAKKTKKNEIGGLHEVKGAGYTATKKVKRDKTVNRRAGLHDKNKNLEGEVRVKRRKPLGLKHVRRMRKFAAVAAVGVVGAVAVFGVGFFKPAKDIILDGEYATVCYAPPTDNSKPTEHTLVEAVGYMNYTLQNQSYWSSDAVTTVIAAGFEQEVKNYKQYYDEVLVSADISIGFVNYGEQFCQANGVVLSRMAATNKPNELQKGMNTAWSTGPATGMTVKAFKQNRGLPPYDFSVYVLNEKTIANAYDTTIADNGDGTYSMQLELNVNTGVDETCAEYYYKLQQKVNGTLYDVPTFYTASISYVFDENWRVLSFEINDTSKTPKSSNLVVNSSSNTKTNFNYEESSAYNTFWDDYFKAEYDRLKDTLSDDDVVEEDTDNALNYLTSAFGSVLTEGAIFKVDLSLDNFALNGVVCVEMEDGLGLTAKLGDILVWLDGETLYINDGSSKYKLNTSGLLSSDGASSLTDGLDVAALLNQMTDGEFTYDKETGVATLVSEVEVFGLTIPMEFEFQKTEAGIELNFLKAQIMLGGKMVDAKLCFGDESDKPAVPTDTAAYQDILNDGITFDIAAQIDGLSLDGIAKIFMRDGALLGVDAILGDFEVYYYCPRNMLYLSAGDVKYSLDLSKIETGETDLSELLGIIDLNSLINNITTGNGVIGTGTDLYVSALDCVLNAALNVQLSGGIKVSADLGFGNHNVSLTAALSNTELLPPNLSGYKDILNTDITLDVNLTLMTGLYNWQTGTRDEVTLNGKVAFALRGGELTEVRADFGGVAVYYEFGANALYLKVGTTKALINLDQIDVGDVNALSLGGNFLPDGLPTVINELLTNLVIESQVISTDINLNLLDAIIPVWAQLDLENLNVSAGLTVFGVDAEATVGLSKTALSGLSAEEKEEYIDVVKDGLKILDNLLGDNISATVSGTVYSNEEKYVEYDGVKYNFNASMEYISSDITVNGDNVEVDSNIYLHFNIALAAKHPDDGSLALDLYLLDANPVTGADGNTTGGYTKDGKLDIFISVSDRVENSRPVQIYAPVEEVLTLVSMVGATANLGSIAVKNSAELTAIIGDISNLLDTMLIDRYLTESVKDKFASLGDSLIPQLLGVSIEELLEKLVGNVDTTVQEVTDRKISLSDKYVASIKTTDESLVLVLNSALIYNNDNIAAEDNLTVTFDRILKDGVYFVGGVSLDNIFFGANQENMLNLGMRLDYNEIARPDASSAFAGYLNAAGLDTLLNGIVNSATHSKDIATDREKEVYGSDITDYILNHYYYLNGKLSANLNVINIVNATINIDIVGVSLTIDEETNDVAVNVRIHYDALTAGAAGANYIVINGESYVDLTIKSGILYIKRIQLSYLEKDSGLSWSGIIGSIAGAAGYDVTPAKSSTPVKYSTPVVTYRVYDFKTMGADMNGIMDLASYVLNLDSKIVKIINEQITSSNGSDYQKTVTDDFDYGDWKNYYFKTYVFTDDGNGNASWKFTFNGTFLSDLMGMEVKDPVITFNATYTVDADGKKSYIVNNLDISDITINFVKVGSNYISMSASGTLNYLNPQLEMKKGCADETVDGSLMWEEAFGCAGENIPATPLWGKLLGVIGKDYLEVGGQIQLGTVRFEYLGLDGTYKELGEKQTVFYNADSKEFYSDVTFPELPVCEDTQAVWDDGYYIDAQGCLVYRAVVYKVNYNSDVAYNGGNYAESHVYTGSGNALLNAAADESGLTFLGWFLADGGNYTLITTQDQLKDYVLANAGTATEINLWAVWYNPTLTGTITDATHSKSGLLHNWYTKGTVNSPFTGISAQIAKAVMSVDMKIVYYVSSDGVSLTKDLNWKNSENVIVDGDFNGSFEKTVKNTTVGTGTGQYVGGKVTITVSCNGLNNITLTGNLFKHV